MTDACLLDRGKTRDIATEGGTRPADKSLIDRRLDAPSPTSRGSSSSSIGVAQTSDRSLLPKT